MRSGRTRGRDIPLRPHRVAPEPAPAGPEPDSTRFEPRCEYGCGSMSECDALKSTRLDAWRVLHANDPEEIERRRRENTAAMYRTLGTSSPYLKES